MNHTSATLDRALHIGSGLFLIATVIVGWGIVCPVVGFLYLVGALQ